MAANGQVPANMNTNSGNSIAYFFLGLSAVIMTACLLGGVVLAMSSGGGGFFPNMGKALGLLLIAAGNLISWILNLFCWYRTRMPWLGVVLVIQGMPAIAFAGWMGTLAVEEFLEGKASDQRTSVFRSIETDDVPSLKQALKQCGPRCREFHTPGRTLMLASLYGSHQAARYLLDNTTDTSRTNTGAYEFYNARTNRYTCEGSYLASLGALDLAVANQDMEMLELLWPTISDDWTRSKALWIAARLDRLDMVKFMAGIGHSTGSSENQNTATHATQPLIRERHRDGPETLLRAAASGAALEVGSWLLEARPIALPQAEIQRAFTELLAFVLDTDTPRSVNFGRLLLQHDADIHSVKIHDQPALERAVHYRSKSLVTMLLELGADPASLSEEDTAQLKALLQEPDRHRTYRQNRPGCVAP